MGALNRGRTTGMVKPVNGRWNRSYNVIYYSNRLKWDHGTSKSV